jgi:plasmid stabilization system protein ParE
MAKHFPVSLADSAVDDLAAIRDYYREQKVPEVGEGLLSDILAAIGDLSHFPDRGRIVPEFGRSHLRELIHSPFRIVYRMDAARVRVVRVWRSERLLKLPE